MKFVDEYWERKGKPVDLWTAKKEDHEVLIKLIEEFNLTSFFEIGTYTAFTTELLSSHPNIKRWKSIDINPRDNHPNITRIDSADYKPAKKCFPNGKEEQYDLIFIDGDHFNVKRDTELALKMHPKIIVWHDYNSISSVKRDVDDCQSVQPVNVEANVAWKKF